MGLQELINRFYRYPKSNLKHLQRFGGYFQYRKMLRGNEQMKLAARHLQPVTSADDGLPIFFLTGKDFFHQTLFCITSLVKTTTAHFKFVLVDDGSLDITFAAEKLPGARIVTATETAENLAAKLPSVVYKRLMEKRGMYAHLKKLTDIHTLGITDRKLVLDSDMLFWREPNAVIEWLKAPGSNLFMLDSHQSYGYSTGLMEGLCGAPVPHRLNVGIAGLSSRCIDWERIARWISELEAREGGSYYLEQALTAMLAAPSPLIILPAEDYIVFPAEEDIRAKKGILHHYVDLSKKGYLRYAWHEFI